MTMGKYFDTAQDVTGIVQPGATVLITDFNTGLPSTLYEDDETTTKTNPTTTNSYGEYSFCAVDGAYNIAITKDGVTRTKTHVTVGAGAGGGGADGADGAGYAATSTTSRSTGTGSKTFTTQAGLAYSIGARARVSSAGTPADFMEGDVTSYSGTTLVINMTYASGSATHADWNINLAGLKGTDGTNGTNYVGTSTTSLALAASGSLAFTTQAGLAYTAGARMRAASAAAPSAFMEGLVTAYSGTTLTVTMDYASTTGTHADWNINLTGIKGTDGTNGTSPGDGWTGFYQGTITNGDLRVTVYALPGQPITGLVVSLGTGTATITLKKNGSAVTGLSCAATTSIVSDLTGAGANTISGGETVDINVASASGASDLYYTIIRS